MFQRILVPLDGSERAEQAIPVAVRIARATGAALTLLRVVERHSPFHGYGYTDEYHTELPEDAKERLEAEVQHAKAYLLHVLTDNAFEGIGIATKVQTGPVAQHILQCAEEQQDDLIVLCSHGTTGLKRWVMGSVAQKIAHSSPIPVLVVREGHPLFADQQEQMNEPLRMLVPLDGSPLAETALLPAAQLCAALAAPQAGALHLVQVVEPIAVMGDMTGVVAEVNQAATLQAEAYLKEIEERFSKDPAYAAHHLTVSSETISGIDVATVLLKIAEGGKSADGQGKTNGSQMMAMSTHGRRGLSYWIVGSIAERVLSVTTQPMLIVRPRKEKVEEQLQPETQVVAPLF